MGQLENRYEIMAHAVFYNKKSINYLNLDNFKDLKNNLSSNNINLKVDLKPGTYTNIIMFPIDFFLDNCDDINHIYNDKCIDTGNKFLKNISLKEYKDFLLSDNNTKNIFEKLYFAKNYLKVFFKIYFDDIIIKIDDDSYFKKLNGDKLEILDYNYEIEKNHIYKLNDIIELNTYNHIYFNDPNIVISDLDFKNANIADNTFFKNLFISEYNDGHLIETFQLKGSFIFDSKKDKENYTTY